MEAKPGSGIMSSCGSTRQSGQISGGIIKILACSSECSGYALQSALSVGERGARLASLGLLGLPRQPGNHVGKSLGSVDSSMRAE